MLQAQARQRALRRVERRGLHCLHHESPVGDGVAGRSGAESKLELHRQSVRGDHETVALSAVVGGARADDVLPLPRGRETSPGRVTGRKDETTPRKGREIHDGVGRNRYVPPRAGSTIGPDTDDARRLAIGAHPAGIELQAVGGPRHRGEIPVRHRGRIGAPKGCQIGARQHDNRRRVVEPHGNLKCIWRERDAEGMRPGIAPPLGDEPQRLAVSRERVEPEKAIP